MTDLASDTSLAPRTRRAYEALYAQSLARAAPASMDGAVRPGVMSPATLARVTTFVRANLAEPLTAERLAEVARMSRSHFFRMLKVSTGLTPQQFIAHERIEEALRRMRTSEEPLTRIALDVGYASSQSFSRSFRRAVGEAPSRLRRRLG